MLEITAMIKHKATLVAKGYIHQLGVDFIEVFASVARMESTDEGQPIQDMEV